MIKKIAWNTFKNTGDINAFLEFKQIENIQKNIGEIEKIANEENKTEKLGKFQDEEINIDRNGL